MSSCLRYRNPIICEHVAGQYVLGTMTPRVKARAEKLRQTVPELDRAISFWSDELSVIHQCGKPEAIPSANVWQQIEKHIELGEDQQKTKTRSTQAIPWWQNLSVWKTTSFLGMATSFALALVLLTSVQQPIKPLATGASYVAAMSAHNQAGADIQFIISAYKKQEGIPSRLQVQWSENHPRTNKVALHLWAEDKDTGQLTYIGLEPSSGTVWDLTKPTWLAVSNSSRLLMTTSNEQPDQQNTLFSGPCIQLKEWQQKT